MAEILRSRDSGIGHIHISNLAKRNALSLEMWRQLEAAVVELDRSPDVRVIVVSGDGDEAFASGADISSFEAVQSGALPLKDFLDIVLKGPAAIRSAAKPVIASIRGICMGAGMEIAAACDIRFAASDARFRMPAALIGLGFPKDVLREFVQIMGRANTADVFMSGRTFDALEAQRMGFVNHVVDVPALDDAVSAYARTLCDNAPLTVRAAKAAISLAFATAIEREELDLQVDSLIDRCYASSDFREGPRAFFERRKPVFTGQ